MTDTSREMLIKELRMIEPLSHGHFSDVGNRAADMLEADAVLAVSKRDYSTQQMREQAEARIQADRAARNAWNIWIEIKEHFGVKDET